MLGNVVPHPGRHSSYHFVSRLSFSVDMACTIFSVRFVSFLTNEISAKLNALKGTINPMTVTIQKSLHVVFSLTSRRKLRQTYPTCSEPHSWWTALVNISLWRVLKWKEKKKSQSRANFKRSNFPGCQKHNSKNANGNKWPPYAGNINVKVYI